MPNNKIFMSKKETESTGKTKWKAKTKGYEKYIFHHGKNMQADYIITSRELCNYIGTNHGSDPLNSMLQNQIVIEDIKKPVEFDSEEAMKKALPSYNNQKEWEDDQKSYNKTKKDIQVALSKISRLLWLHCDITIQNKMLLDKDFQVMKDNDGGEMYRIITKIMYGVAAVQNPIWASIESLFNLLFIRETSTIALPNIIRHLRIEG